MFVLVLETIRTGAMRVGHITVDTEETQILRITVLPVLTNTSKSTFPPVNQVKDPGNKLC